MAMSEKAADGRGQPASRVLGICFLWGTIVPVVAWILAAIVRRPELFTSAYRWDPFALVIFTIVVAAVALLPVPVSRVLQLTLSFPILLGVGMLRGPLGSGAVACAGSFDT